MRIGDSLSSHKLKPTIRDTHRHILCRFYQFPRRFWTISATSAEIDAPFSSTKCSAPKGRPAYIHFDNAARR